MKNTAQFWQDIGYAIVSNMRGEVQRTTRAFKIYGSVCPYLCFYGPYVRIFGTQVFQWYKQNCISDNESVKNSAHFWRDIGNTIVSNMRGKVQCTTRAFKIYGFVYSQMCLYGSAVRIFGTRVFQWYKQN